MKKLHLSVDHSTLRTIQGKIRLMRTGGWGTIFAPLMTSIDYSLGFESIVVNGIVVRRVEEE